MNGSKDNIEPFSEKRVAFLVYKLLNKKQNNRNPKF